MISEPSPKERGTLFRELDIGEIVLILKEDDVPCKLQCGTVIQSRCFAAAIKFVRIKNSTLKAMRTRHTIWSVSTRRMLPILPLSLGLAAILAIIIIR